MNWKEYEEAVYFECQRVYGRDNTFLNVSIKGVISQTTRQIDILVKNKTVSRLEQIAFEVKYYRNLDISKTSYDKWHEELCDKIVDTYAPAGIIFNYGQAQKWVNMTMKYLLLLRNRKAQSLEKHFHIPIDSYIIEDVREDVYVDGIEPWSQMEKGKYIEYQGKLLDYVKKKGYGSPLEWEAESWNKQKEKRL